MNGRLKIDRLFFQSRFGIALIVITAVILLFAGLAALRPLPGRHVIMATGAPGSVYARVGERYREILAREGVKLELMQTNGAVDNERLLRDPRSGVGVGFVQSGSLSEEASRQLESLGTVFYEEVWVFCRCPVPMRPLRELASGWRASIGPVGSADRPLALRLLGLNGVGPETIKLYGYAPNEAEKALLANDIDVAIFLSGWDSPVVERLARTEGITLVGFPRADAYVALVPTWTKLILPRGVADLAEDRPAADTALIASKASLAVRKDLHPALQYLLLQAAIEVHSRPDIFQRAGEFPAAEEIDLPLSDAARHIYRAGPSFLQRSLPFWLAELVQRLLVLLLPIAGIVYPLWSLAPRIYAWQMKRRVNRMYAELKVVERDLRVATSATQPTLINRLDELDARALDLKVPVTFTESTFNLRAHIRGMRARALAPHSASGPPRDPGARF